MRAKKVFEVMKHVNLIEISIPVAIILASVFLPLRPFVRQAFICVILIWLGIEAMTGFNFWK